MTHPILAIDHGDARIGLAATDEFGIGTHPVETIDCRKSEPIPRILEIIHKRKITAVVLGEIPLTFFDERFTTVTAAEKLRVAGKKAKHQKDIIDQAAALEILRDYLGW